MLKLETLTDLEALHHNQVPESATLEYKASPAAENTEPRKNEIAKDVSAMANADGGQIIYGMTEANHLPAGLDDGIDPSHFNGLWFEQVIQQNVRQQIEGLKIVAIQRGNGNIAVVLTVPAAIKRAPHQLARDGRYYRRRNFRNDIMEDYEVREAMRRSTQAQPYIQFSFPDGGLKGTFAERHDNGEHRFRLRAMLGNRSRQPAYYAMVTLFIDSIANVVPSDPSISPFTERTAYRDEHGNAFHAIKRQFGIPNDFPIFQEALVPVSNPPLLISLDYSSTNQGGMHIGYEILTPGYLDKQFGIIRFNYGRMTIEFPTKISDA